MHERLNIFVIILLLFEIDLIRNLIMENFFEPICLNNFMTTHNCRIYLEIQIQATDLWNIFLLFCRTLNYSNHLNTMSNPYKF